jgi:hypothetical protein
MRAPHGRQRENEKSLFLKCGLAAFLSVKVETTFGSADAEKENLANRDILYSRRCHSR